MRGSSILFFSLRVWHLWYKDLLFSILGLFGSGSCTLDVACHLFRVKSPGFCQNFMASPELGPLAFPLRIFIQFVKTGLNDRG